jgi:cysteine desulfurase
MTATRTTYLDNAATTPMREEAIDAMMPLLSGSFGNPSGPHHVARAARAALDEARESLAAVLGADPGEIVFTSGGTEADSLAVCGVHARRGGTVLCSSIEHKAVLAAAKAVGGRPFGGTSGATASGIVDLDALRSELDAGGEPVSLVSVMTANNEIGTIQPISEVIEIVRRSARQAVVHTDAVQAVAWLDVADVCREVDLLSISAHKFGGPKGVGALVVRSRVRESIGPILHGGGQERDLRSGTHNVAGIVAMAVAAQYAAKERDETAERASALRDRLESSVLGRVEGVAVTGSASPRLSCTSHLRFEGVEAEELLMLLDRRGVAASAGSACSSGAAEPSHVLQAMGMTPTEARSCVRFSLGRTTTKDEIDIAIEAVVDSVATLRG